MKTIEEQLKAISELIGDGHNIKVKEDGFLSRGFVINNGELVFKFPRRSDVSYEMEINNLNYINNLNLGVNLQKVAYTSQSNEYLGINGVRGRSLEEITLGKDMKTQVGRQLGAFLNNLHQVQNFDGKPCRLDDEIEAWQDRVRYVADYLHKTFTEEECKTINYLMFEYIPKRLKELGENLVFSHGDLGDGNIFVDDDGTVGVIDFNESGLLDEAGDFMDISDDEIREEMLSEYQADKVLREKVEIRRDIRPLIVLKPYLARNNQETLNALIKSIRKTINKYSSAVKE